MASNPLPLPLARNPSGNPPTAAQLALEPKARGANRSTKVAGKLKVLPDEGEIPSQSKVLGEAARATVKDVEPKDEAAPEPAPPVLAAEPVSEAKETVPAGGDVTAGGLVSSSNSNWAAMMAAAMPKPKPVTDAAQVAAVPTTATVSSPQEIKAETAVVEDKAVAPEVLAAPPAESENKEVTAVEEPKPVVEEPKEIKPKAPETAASASAPSTPKKDSPAAPTTPGSNGKASRSGTLRGLKFPGHRRQSSGDVTPEKNRSVSETTKDSSRKKRMSLFGKVKEAFHKDKAPEKA